MVFLHDLETDLIEQEIIYLYENGVQISDMSEHLKGNFQYDFTLTKNEDLLNVTINSSDDIDFIELNLNELYKRSLDINAADFMPVKFDDPNDPTLAAEKARLEELRKEEFNKARELYCL